MNRVNSIFGRDLGVRLVLINNETQIIYTNGATDSYNDPPGTSSINNQNQTNIDNVIGNGNYDIGHVVGIGSGGLALRPSGCRDGLKAQGSTGRATPQGDPFDVDFVAHEIGHQLNAQHTFNDNTNGSCGGNNRAAGSAYEPGSGSTIMAYAGICGAADLQPNSDDYFHAKSVEDIRYYVHDEGGDGSTCGTATPTGNTIPTASFPLNHTIPNGTPFRLYMADYSDPDPGDAILYTWEEYDLGLPSPPEGDAGDRPLFRSYKFSRNSDRIFPSLRYILNNSNNPPATYNCGTPGSPKTCLTGETLPSSTRTMFFRLTLRDNSDGVAIFDDVTINIRGDSGPFVVTQPNLGASWTQGAQRTVTWNVANTNNAPVSCANVKISLSADGGNTFSRVLAESTPNDGSETITVPPDVETSQARVKVEAVDNIFFDISDANFTIGPPSVTNANDSGLGSLRQAILDARSLTGGGRTITFNIPGPGLKTINVLTPLPALEGVTLNARSQGGDGYTGPPLIELNGANCQPYEDRSPANGLIIIGNNGGVMGVVINGFAGAGIVIQGGRNNRIQGNYIGTDASGTARVPNVQDGIRIIGGSDNLIGGTEANMGNLISGNGTLCCGNSGVSVAADAIEINGNTATRNIVQGNFIGTNAAGTAALGNTASGVHIVNAPGNIIGGTSAGARNIIADGGVRANYTAAHGIEITGSTGSLASGTLIQGNYIGTDVSGTLDLSSNGAGISLTNAPNTVIGGTSAGARNVIVSRGSYAISTPGPCNGCPVDLGGGNTIQGNYIGTNAAGTAQLGNRSGIFLSNPNNLIGGTSAGARNVIAGLGVSAVFLDEDRANNNTIQGNYIGLSADGTAALGTTAFGIEIQRATGNVIGGPTPAARNVIVTSHVGVYLFGSGGVLRDTLIQGNYFGTNAAGTAVLLRGTTGIVIESASNNTVSGNVIAGFASHGINIYSNSPAASGNVLRGNLIGTNAAGTSALPNNTGIYINGTTNGSNTIGGTTPEARNVISGNTVNGIELSLPTTTVQGNYIGVAADGVTALGNQGNGIYLSSGANHVIGGTGAGAGNVVAFNGAAGTGTNYAGIAVISNGNSIRGNSIFSNTGLGIDLGGRGLTVNDNCDPDGSFGNFQQNYPVLASANSSGGSTTITGTLNSTPSTAFVIDFYSSPACDPLGNGEGKTYLGSTMVTTAADCNATINATLPVFIPSGQVITATATDPQGNTSEFSACRAVVAPPSLQFSAATYSVAENAGTATITVTRTGGSSGPASVAYATANGTATGGDSCGGSVDYRTTSGTLNWANGDAASKTFTVTVCNDSLFENNETLTLTLSNATGAALGSPSTAALTITNDDAAPPTPAAGSVIISEFRFRGPTPAAGGDGALDEFIELYNATDSPIAVGDTASVGWTLVGSDGLVRCTIPNGTVIPARGHFLVVNNSDPGGYSLTAYAAADLTYTTDIVDDIGIALFRSAVNFDLTHRLDAVGFSSVADTLYREGGGLPPVGNTGGQYSWVRKIITTAGVSGTGRPQDTGDNAADFLLVATDPSLLPNPAARLGAPGPANLSSPLQRNAQTRATLLDPAQSAAAPANRYRYRCTDADRPADCDANSPLGYLSIRRTYTNNTGQPVTRLRFRVVDISTMPEGTGPGGNNIAELRVLSRSGSFSVPPLVGSPITVQGLTVEQPPNQASGGGFNTSLVAPTISLETPLSATPPNNQIRVEFLLGIVQGGNFRFLVNVEALP